MVLLEDMAGEALMPLSYGGDISSKEEALKLFRWDEKVVYSASRLFDGTNLREVVDAIGSQSVSVCVNYVESRFFGRMVRCHKTNKKLGGLGEVTQTTASIGLEKCLAEHNARR